MAGAAIGDIGMGGKENDKGMGGWGGNRANITFSERRTSVTRTTADTNAVGNFAAAEALVFEIFLLTLMLNVTNLGSRLDDV